MITLVNGPESVLQEGKVILTQGCETQDGIFYFTENGGTSRNSAFLRDGKFLRPAGGSKENPQYAEIGTNGKHIAAPKKGDTILYYRDPNSRIVWFHALQGNDEQ